MKKRTLLWHYPASALLAAGAFYAGWAAKESSTKQPAQMGRTYRSSAQPRRRSRIQGGRSPIPSMERSTAPSSCVPFRRRRSKIASAGDWPAPIPLNAISCSPRSCHRSHRRTRKRWERSSKAWQRPTRSTRTSIVSCSRGPGWMDLPRWPTAKREPAAHLTRPSKAGRRRSGGCHGLP